MSKSWHNVAIGGIGSEPKYVHCAYLDEAERWNGWVCPYFEKSEVERMSAWLPELEDGLVYSAEEDTFSSTYETKAGEVFPGLEIDGMHLYPIGCGSWTWDLVEDAASA